jgi:3D (Asp-Asp-Asp) domain-containing protein
MKTLIGGVVLSIVGTLPGPAIHYVAPPETIEIRAEVTAYTSSVDETDDTPEITASGARTRDGIAACPAKYPFGTKVIIAGKEYECQDRMNARYRDQSKFDIWVESKDEAFQWGRRELAIEIRK